MTLLHGSSRFARERAAITLGKLALDAENRVSLAQAGAIGPFVAMVRGGSDEAQGKAAWALGHVALNPFPSSEK